LSFLAITTINAATFSGKVVRVLDGDTIEEDIEDDTAVMWTESFDRSNNHTGATKLKEEVSVEEALHTEILINQTLIDLLVAKGVCMKTVSGYGIQEFILADLKSVGSNMNLDGQC